jgi:hypothetical protein
VPEHPLHSIHRSKGAGDNPGGLEFNFLGPAAKYLNLKALRCLNQEVDPPLKGFDQGYLEIWAG